MATAHLWKMSAQPASNYDLSNYFLSLMLLRSSGWIMMAKIGSLLIRQLTFDVMCSKNEQLKSRLKSLGRAQENDVAKCLAIYQALHPGTLSIYRFYSHVYFFCSALNYANLAEQRWTWFFLYGGLPLRRCKAIKGWIFIQISKY